jgi:predicted acyltransferase
MKNRLLELDFLRGLSVIGMVMVIIPGDWGQRFSWLDHAAWKGYPLADMIFPTFLFCVGFSMVLSFKSRAQKGATQASLIKHIFFRSFILILIGLLISFLESGNFSNIRIPGVLQRIGICYLLVGFIVLVSLRKKEKAKFRFLIGMVSGISILYWAVLYFIPVPGFDPPGFDSVNSWPAYLDREIFGPKHLWLLGKTNDAITYDPEGLLSNISACINMIAGTLIGFLYVDKRQFYTPKFLFTIGISLVIIGLTLDFSGVNPIIKKIWTSSFAFFSTGISIVILASIKASISSTFLSNLYYPAKIYGSNALLAFIMAFISLRFFDTPWISVANESFSIRSYGFKLISNDVTNLQFASLLFTSIYLTILFFLLWLLYKKEWFLKI